LGHRKRKLGGSSIGPKPGGTKDAIAKRKKAQEEAQRKKNAEKVVKKKKTVKKTVKKKVIKKKPTGSIREKFTNSFI